MEFDFFDSQYNALVSGMAKLMPFIDFYADRLALIRSAISILRDHVVNNGFDSEEEEVLFFKQVKPRFYALFIFEVEHYNMLFTLPKGTDDMIRDYYYHELSVIGRFFDQHAFLYGYFKRGESAMDKCFFLRSSFDPLQPFAGAGFLGLEAEFWSNQDYNFAKFLALDRLQDFLIKQIGNLNPRFSYAESKRRTVRNELKWTGDKVDLVELAYGIYLMGSLNNGNADLAAIVSWLESSLDIGLGSVYRKFVDISRRKVVSFTRYLDGAREAVARHVLENEG
jgi:hypothetical protein